MIFGDTSKRAEDWAVNIPRDKTLSATINIFLNRDGDQRIFLLPITSQQSFISSYRST